MGCGKWLPPLVNNFDTNTTDSINVKISKGPKFPKNRSAMAAAVVAETIKIAPQQFLCGQGLNLSSRF